MRRSPLRARPKPKGTDRALAAAWVKAVVPRGARCLLCGTRDRLQGHHVIAQQAIRGCARELNLTAQSTQEFLWDARNGVAVCDVCHSRHTGAYRRIPRYLLPASVYAFVEDLDALYVNRRPVLARLRREYPAV